MIPAALLVAAAAIAGCGSSSNSSSSSASSQPASTPQESSSSTQQTSSSGAGATSTRVALITTKHAKMGTILAYGPKRMTVYMFERDRGKSSSCTGACASAWPPVLGKPRSGGGAMASNLGTTTRPDGTTQVTYKGHPLYRFVKDKDDGDSYGQGLKAFGAGWYVLKPSGEKVDES
jgi:predicted lipoprotein with Yx(FWY)xxD motif